MRRMLFVLLLSVAAASCGSAAPIRPASSAGAVDDATITARVKTALLNDRQIDATKIDVTTDNGVVTMSGTVKSQADEARAVELARQAPGVRDVRTNLRVGG